MPKLKVNNLDLNYEMTGKGQSVLFVHGLGSSSRDWEEQVNYFSKDYQVVTIDVRGHGLSDKPPGPYSIKLFSDDTAALITSLDLSPVHIAGISMGGMIAFQLAVDNPNLLKSMTIVNSGPEMIARSFKEKLMIFQRSVIFRLLSMQKIGEVLAGRLFPKADQEELRIKMVKRWAENDKRAYTDSFKALVGWSVAEHIGNIKCPTLVIAADEDYTPVSLKEDYVSKMKDAQLVLINDSRHATPLDRPAEFNKTLATFLSKHS
ncbi:MAG: alpha/beta hydrolase [Deltaproteobacteria bacterium]|nr:alpha/beta hydrolase [Deltaproteobacteria bacterium]MBW2364765.1 alpha/beta hydrolase [Deltaproteobacteria bacterium]